MSESKPQSFRNHTSVDPLYFSALIAMGLVLVLSIFILATNLHSHLLTSIWIVASTLILLVIAMKARMYPLKLEDRIIRLEERIRIDALLPEHLRKRLPELNEDQLIGLRFASDAEIPTLVEMTLDKHLDRKQIKERIQNWRPDHWRI